MTLKNNLTVQIDGNNFPIQWIRKKNRRDNSFTLKAKNYSTYAIYTSYNATYEEVLRFLNNHLASFIQKVNKKIDGVNYYLNLENLTFSLFGKSVSLELIIGNNVDWEKFKSDVAYRKTFYKQIHNWLVKHGQKLFELRLKAWFKTMGYKTELPSISYKWLDYKWGSYNTKNQLIFNSKLLCFPFETIDCIIVHELCHIKHMNHKPQFYAEMRKYLPNYLQLEKNLIYIV